MSFCQKWTKFSLLFLLFNRGEFESASLSSSGTGCPWLPVFLVAYYQLNEFALKLKFNSHSHQYYSSWALPFIQSPPQYYGALRGRSVSLIAKVSIESHSTCHSTWGCLSMITWQLKLSSLASPFSSLLKCSSFKVLVNQPCVVPGDFCHQLFCVYKHFAHARVSFTVGPSVTLFQGDRDKIIELIPELKCERNIALSVASIYIYWHITLMGNYQRAGNLRNYPQH